MASKVLGVLSRFGKERGYTCLVRTGQHLLPLDSFFLHQVGTSQMYHSLRNNTSPERLLQQKPMFCRSKYLAPDPLQTRSSKLMGMRI
jgi:hypothetical protein